MQRTANALPPRQTSHAWVSCINQRERIGWKQSNMQLETSTIHFAQIKTKACLLSSNRISIRQSFRSVRPTFLSDQYANELQWRIVLLKEMGLQEVGGFTGGESELKTLAERTDRLAWRGWFRVVAKDEGSERGANLARAHCCSWGSSLSDGFCLSRACNLNNFRPSSLQRHPLRLWKHIVTPPLPVHPFTAASRSPGETLHFSRLESIRCRLILELMDEICISNPSWHRKPVRFRIDFESGKK